MTIEEALALREGDYVVTKLSAPAYRPLRVTAKWANEKQTIVLVRINSIAGQDWLDATGYDLPPAGMKWSLFDRRWMTPEEYREKYPEAVTSRGKRQRATANV